MRVHMHACLPTNPCSRLERTAATCAGSRDPINPNLGRPSTSTKFVHARRWDEWMEKSAPSFGRSLAACTITILIFLLLLIPKKNEFGFCLPWNSKLRVPKLVANSILFLWWCSVKNFVQGSYFSLTLFCLCQLEITKCLFCKRNYSLCFKL